MSGRYQPHGGELKHRGLIGVLGWGLGLLAGLPSPSADRVVLQLKWRHQWQFAGYYAAVEKGYFREAGLEVEIREAHPGPDPALEVIEGRAQYGISGPDLLRLRAQGHPVVCLAAIFQHSPLALITRADDPIRQIQDLQGRILALEPQDADLLAMLRSEGLRPEAYRRVAHAYSVGPLLRGEVDAMSAYITTEPWEAAQAKVAVRTFAPRSLGIDFYGDCLFTTATEVQKHPQRAAAFRTASLKGWRYALDHPEEVVGWLGQKYPSLRPPEALRFEAERTRPLIQADVVELGYQSPGRWASILEAYVEAGLVPRGLSLQGFLFDPAPPRSPWLRLAFLLSLLALAATAAVLGTFLRLQRRLLQEAQAREAAELSYRSMLEAAGLPILITRPSGELLYANPRAQELFELDASRPEGFDVNGLFADPIQRTRVIGQLLAERGAPDVEVDLRRTSGEIFWALVSTSLVPHQGEEVVFATISVITERKRTEEALRASEERFRSVAEQTGQLIYEVDLATGQNSWAGAIQAITGFTREAFEALGPDTWSRQIHPEDRAEALEALRRAREAAAPFAVEYRFQRRDGTYFFVEDRGVFEAGPEGTATRMLGVLEDVTQRRIAEHALRESEASVRSLFEAAPFPLVVTTQEGGAFRFANQEAFAFFGYEDAEPSVEPHRVWAELSDRTRLLELLAANGKVDHFETQLLRRTGEPRWVVLSARTIPFRGEPCLLTAHMDITERKRLEEDRRQAHKLEGLALMAGGIAHDFNNLFQAILGNLEVLRARLQGGEDRTHQALDRAEDALRKAANLSHALLDFSGKGLGARVQVDLRVMGATEVEAQRALAPDGVEVRFATEGSSCSVEGDPEQLRQALRALISNSLEAMAGRKGAVDVRVRPAGEPRELAEGLWVLPLPSGERAVVEVQDVGPGVTPEVLTRMFDPFFSTKPQGRGLGLSATLGILQSHGAGLQVVRPAAGGLLLRLHFPARRAASESLVPLPRVTAEASEGPRTVLLVDDEEALRETLQEALEQVLGYRVLTAADGLEALEVFQARADEIAVVLMDATMPRMGGVEAFEAMKRLRPGTRAVLCSGFAESSGVQTAAGHGFRSFLKKPFQIAELQRVLEAALAE